MSHVVNQKVVGIRAWRLLLFVRTFPHQSFVPLPLSTYWTIITVARRKNELVGINRMIVPFLACGDLSGFDSDQSYPLPDSNPRLSSSEQSLIDDYKYHEPAQKPINPPIRVPGQKSWKS